MSKVNVCDESILFKNYYLTQLNVVPTVTKFTLMVLLM